MSRIADDSASIAQRLKEIEEEKLQAVTGEEPKVGEYAVGWPATSVEDVYG